VQFKAVTANLPWHRDLKRWGIVLASRSTLVSVCALKSPCGWLYSAVSPSGLNDIPGNEDKVIVTKTYSNLNLHIPDVVV